VTDRALAFAALHDCAMVSTARRLRFPLTPGHLMTRAEAAQILAEREAEGRGLYFDYFRGMVMKVDMACWPLDLRFFNRDHGDGAGEAALQMAGVTT
jgi:hypothetical protein